MADNWEDEEFEVPAAAAPKATWDDEDLDEGEIKAGWTESWEDSDEEEEKPQAAAPVKKKVSLAQRIAERNAENERKRQELAEKANQDDDEEDEEDIVSKRQRQIALEQAADLENATDMFRGVSVQDREAADKIASANPKSKEEFEAFKKALVERIEMFKSQRAYPTFVENLTTELARGLKDVDVRKVASALTRIANEKQRESKDKGKKKATKKPSVQVSSAGVDTTDYGAYADADYDDFM
ncbi:eukaryotic translation initiation factor 3 subunit J [Thamnocephalis sphaerospora]|uniref:Eukaryotic translation initiation factor 3 subunit J n=1 Tax=Thamnocephalis sphaerospora TaxID=78915 RepID=A0A4P9XUX7_9FUNG|nr:eukaryotic translation initiation factor 3 subunit J [Thamnocephalis sphaerospora]|eukprot:RKP10043.1 eukaryotic translation initiation factor 3 subunit J [Thamnocephalis sphaerospora]